MIFLFIIIYWAKIWFLIKNSSVKISLIILKIIVEGVLNHFFSKKGKIIFAFYLYDFYKTLIKFIYRRSIWKKQ